jgi:hypothetical protein
VACAGSCRGSPRDLCDTAAVASEAPRSPTMVSNIRSPGLPWNHALAQVRKQAKAPYRQHGAAYAAVQTGVPHAPSAVGRLRTAGSNDCPAYTSGWHTRRQTIADQLGHVGAQFLVVGR